MYQTDKHALLRTVWNSNAGRQEDANASVHENICSPIILCGIYSYCLISFYDGRQSSPVQFILTVTHMLRLLRPPWFFGRARPKLFIFASQTEFLSLGWIRQLSWVRMLERSRL
jgi:hypothetical protein